MLFILEIVLAIILYNLGGWWAVVILLFHSFIMDRHFKNKIEKIVNYYELGIGKDEE